MLNSRLSRSFFTLLSFCLTPGTVLAHGISEEARRRMIEGGDLEYIRLGAEHMITGYDHLLFLFGVMFFLTRMMDIIKFVSAFTIGHTITLIFATYFGITANYYLIDAVIALTVAYKGFENLDGFRKYLNAASPPLLFMVLAFGLIHGFGLSTRLQELPIREDGQMLLHILSFNLGVEIGQIAALVVMWGLLRLLQTGRHFPVFSKVVNSGLIAAGALLLMMQLHGYSHTAHPDDFAMSRDDHAHVHEEFFGDHAHNPDGSHVNPADEHGDPHSPDGSPVDAEDGHDDHAHNPDGSHVDSADDHGPAPAAAEPHSHDAKPVHSHDGGAPHSHSNSMAHE